MQIIFIRLSFFSYSCNPSKHEIYHGITEPRFARRTVCSSSTERKFKLQDSQCAIYGMDFDVAGGLWSKALCGDRNSSYFNSRITSLVGSVRESIMKIASLLGSLLAALVVAFAARSVPAQEAMRVA